MSDSATNYIPRTIAREEDDDQMELLMRHSSPFTTREGAVTSPLTERNISPSLARPRSNPRNRTPMRYTSPLHSEAFRIPEEDPPMGRGGITIRPMAGRAVGTSTRARTAFQSYGGISEERPIVTKSRKQGPSHRKVRRWNNDNFVNLAAEIKSGNKGGRAAQALLLGQADAAQYRSITNAQDHESKAMRRLREDESLRGVREKFFEGELNALPAKATPARPDIVATTPEEMLLRMEARLRRVVVKACENSVPASSVVNHVEQFLIQAHGGASLEGTTPNNHNEASNWWQDILIEPPSVTRRERDGTVLTRFVFDGDSANGGFHRLLIHGLCQFHGLKAMSSTINPEINGNTVQARLLNAAGRVQMENRAIKMVDYIMERKFLRDNSSRGVKELSTTSVPNRLAESLQTLQV